ncbi:MAG: MiaB/RimO family radical SAM methylthiotransferase [Solirubrobacteraceae bacterium]
MSTFAVKFLGCKVSQADAMSARTALLAGGHAETRPEDAELHFVNTCAITGEAEAKSRQAVRRSLGQAREVYVAGCACNLDTGAFARLSPRVRPLAGTSEDACAALQAATGACADLEHGLLDRARQREGGASPAGARTRGFVKVQDGCASRCSYCVIPSVRGDARSRPSGGVLDEVRRRVAMGQPEMVMTGISVGDYRDPDRGLTLGELMREVARVDGVQRVRLSSVEVIHVDDSLIDALASEPRICPHLHVPMQSGDDRVLAAMGRHYDAGEYLDHVARLRRAVPGVRVTTDVIVGFPTEDEGAFERTLALIDAAAITRVHAFSYSARPGTTAAALDDRVSPEECKRRSRALRGHSEARSRVHRSGKLGTVERVLIDKVSGAQCSGYTPDYTRCYLPAGAGGRGEVVEVTCAELHADGIRCIPGDRIGSVEADRMRCITEG